VSRKCGKVKGAGVVKARMMPGAKVLLSRHDWTLACIESANPDKVISRSTISPGGTRRVLYFPREIRDPPPTQQRTPRPSTKLRVSRSSSIYSPQRSVVLLSRRTRKKARFRPVISILPITRPYQLMNINAHAQRPNPPRPLHPTHLPQCTICSTAPPPPFAGRKQNGL